MKRIILVALLFKGTQVMAGAPFVTVGNSNDNSCDYSSIQVAIDAEVSEEIRIATNGSPYFEKIKIYSIDQTLKGGYADCQSAANNITDLSRPILDGGNTGSVVDVRGSLGPNDVQLQNLVIGNGENGILVLSADVDLLINNVWLFNNNDHGIEISNNVDAEVIINDSTLSFNQRGGLSCVDEGAQVIVAGDTHVVDNTTVDSGGGLRFRNGCDGVIYSPVVIENNEAESRGGGVSVEGGSEVSILGLFSNCQNGLCFGDNDQPVIIRNNQAENSGGGISALSNGSSINVVNVLLENNVAIRGGAVSAAIQSEVTLFGFDGEEGCWSPGKCLQVLANKADRGGAFYTSNEAQLRVATTWVKDSRANNGVVAYVADESGFLLNNSLITENGDAGSGGYLDESLIFLPGGSFDQGEATLEYVTITDNQIVNSVIQNNEGSFRIHSSIVDESVDVYESDEPISSSFECVMAHETTSFSAGGTVMVGTPEFMNAATGDYRHKPTSPAVDYCYEIDSSALNDMELEQHGFDDPNKTNLHGTFDIGADEYIIDNDIIFKDGFE